VAAGRLGAEALVEAMGGSGTVVLLRYRVGSASTEDRERGFLEAMAEHPGVTVSVQDRYAGASSASAQSTALAMLPALREADGVFCSQESATAGMLLALRREGLLETTAFVGFDSSPPLVAGLRAGEIDALVVQDPVRMGALSVELAKRHLDGGSVDAINDTGAVVVRAADLDDPRIAALVE
jgi:ribose transport system substrate-binding protein